MSGPLSVTIVRRCPTLPHPVECSTIGAGGLSFRVRDGTGRSPSAKTTDNTIHIVYLLSHPPITDNDGDGGGGVLRVTQWMRVTSLFAPACSRASWLWVKSSAY